MDEGFEPASFLFKNGNQPVVLYEQIIIANGCWVAEKTKQKGTKRKERRTCWEMVAAAKKKILRGPGACRQLGIDLFFCRKL